MPISPITLQRRHAELGRIRLGQKGDRGQPQKLAAFRFTSASERYITDLAALYGGTPQRWDNNGKPEFEVFTTATSLPVIVVKGGLSQWMETWTGGGVAHRCDGERQVDGTYCDPEDPQHKAAKPTTRLSVMLPELEAVGVWRMESHGWNAAAEIPAVAELAQYVGDLVPAHLHLMERRTVKDGKTSRFVVPVLDLQIGTARLRQLVAERSGTAELEGGGSGPAALVAASSDGEDWAPFHARLGAAATLEDLTDLWHEMVHAELVGQAAAEEGRLSPEAARFTEAFKERAAAIKFGLTAGGHGEGDDAARAASSPTPTPTPEPDADGVVDGVVVEDPPDDAVADGATDDADAVWQRVLAVAGARGMSLGAVLDDFPAQMGGLDPDQATAGELLAYLDLLNARDEVTA